MHTLSQLVKFRKDIIDKVSLINLKETIDNIYNVFNQIDHGYGDYFSIKEKIRKASDDYKSIVSKSELIQYELSSIVYDIDFAITQKIFDINQRNEYKDAFIAGRARVFKIDSEVNNIIEITITKYVDWHYPGLRLGCRHVGQKDIDTIINNQIEINHEISKYYSNCMVVCDPLYFYDFDEHLINPAVDHFNDVYRRRIRTYAGSDLDQLPKEQFGFVFSWMLFNYADIETLYSYLYKIYDLLRPGGVLMFSYNNIDIEQSAKTAELGLMSAISKRQLLDNLNKIGFVCEDSNDLPNSDPAIQIISWLELRKPGILNTTKTAQAMAQILMK